MGHWLDPRLLNLLLSNPNLKVQLLLLCSTPPKQRRFYLPPPPLLLCDAHLHISSPILKARAACFLLWKAICGLVGAPSPQVTLAWYGLMKKKCKVMSHLEYFLFLCAHKPPRTIYLITSKVHSVSDDLRIISCCPSLEDQSIVSINRLLSICVKHLVQRNTLAQCDVTGSEMHWRSS